jgi:hypothetical protein
MAKNRSSELRSKNPSGPVGAPATGLANGGIDRRTFVRNGAVIVVATLGCGEGTDPTRLGTVRVLLVGLHPSAVNGGSAVATPVGGGTPVVIPVPLAGDQSSPAPVGSYTVEYTPPANHLLAGGQENPRTVEIQEGVTTTIELTLVSTGTIQVNVTGLTGSPANGGTAVAQRTDAAGTAVNMDVSVAGAASAVVPTGTYTVTYTPPAGFSVTGTNPGTGLAVGLGAATPANFTASANPTTGQILITVTGLTGAPGGGSVSAQLSNGTGSTFNGTLSTPSGGSSSATLSSVPPGAYNVTYTPPSGFRLQAGQANPAAATVTAGNTANVNMTAEAVPTAGILFHSDWSTATGTTEAALRDTSKAKPWTARRDNDGILTVVAAAGRGFPAGMTNCLRVGHLAPQVHSAEVSNDNVWPVPNVGDKLFFRLYLRNEIADNQGDLSTTINSHHPVEPASGTCANAWSLTYASKNDGTFPFRFATLENTSPRNRWILGPSQANLQKNHTYRFEWMLERQAGGFLLEIRVYNEAGALLYDKNSIYNNAGTLTLAASGLLTMNATCLNKLLVGTNGGGWVFSATQYSYFGGVMVRSDDWCGPYTP